MRVSLILGTAFALSLLLACCGQSYAEFRQGEEVTIAAGEVIDDDIYISANQVTVDGTINGDLIVAAQQININGLVEGDLIAAANQIVVNGRISDDTRIAGQMLMLQDGADIGDDLIAAGYSLECAQASRVGGEVAFAGHQSIFAGRIDGKVKLAATNCQLSGSFGDDIEAKVEGGGSSPVGFWGAIIPVVPQGLTVDESADIAGDLAYQSTREANISADSTIAGKVGHSQIDSNETQSLTIADRAIAVVQQFIALFFFGLLLVYVCPHWTGQVVNNVQRRPLASLGWGALTLIAVLLGTVLFLILTIAIALLLGFTSLDNLILTWVGLGTLTTAVVVVGSYTLFMWFAKVIVSLWAGNRLINGPDWTSKSRLLALVLGVSIFVALSWIPMFGGSASLVIMLVGAGSVVIWMFNKSESLSAGKPKA